MTAKICGCHLNFSVIILDRGSFQKFPQPRLQISSVRRLCHFVDRGLTEIQRLYQEQGIFYTCTISVQISPDNIQYMALTMTVTCAFMVTQQSRQTSRSVKVTDITTVSVMRTEPWRRIDAHQRTWSVQNAAARLVTGLRRTEHITLILKSLHWLPIRQRVT